MKFNPFTGLFDYSLDRALLDTLYVRKIGDAMTGNLDIVNASTTARMALYGAGDTYNYATYGLSNGDATKSWFLNHRKNIAGGENNQFTIEEFDGANYNPRVRIYVGGQVDIPNYLSVGTFTTSGSFGVGITGISSTTTLDYQHASVFCDASGGAFSVNLPAASTCVGRIYTIKKYDSSINAVTVDGNGTEQIDGAGTYALPIQYKYVQIQSNSVGWFVIANN